MPTLRTHVRAHLRLLIAFGAGVAAALLLPGSIGLLTRCLLGWNLMVWLYLLPLGWMMWHADHHSLRRVAAAQAESAPAVLAIVSTAAVVSLVGVVIELSAAKQPGAAHAMPHVVLGLATVIGAWTLVPTMFALSYASVYYRSAAGQGLSFPGSGEVFAPAYADFLYFSFTIAVASQTSDVSVTTQRMRRLVLMQALLSFGFNTAILAFTINLAASMF